MLFNIANWLTTKDMVISFVRSDVNCDVLRPAAPPTRTTTAAAAVMKVESEKAVRHISLVYCSGALRDLWLCSVHHCSFIALPLWKIATHRQLSNREPAGRTSSASRVTGTHGVTKKCRDGRCVCVCDAVLTLVTYLVHQGVVIKECLGVCVLKAALLTSYTRADGTELAN